MARLDIPDGDLPEIARVWELRPEMGEAVARPLASPCTRRASSRRACARPRACASRRSTAASCARGWRIPELAEQGVNEELYAHVEQWRDHPEYSEPERLAIEYAERFALDHRTIDDAFFDRLKEHFTDADILDLTICIGNWVAFGRLTMLLDLDEACETRIRETV